ncbi:hypothetical protein [Caenibacillus caldisaponilyticus]|uniref:hypothetical protein n=1 Tax=Caenibacillus caldisaponilyticus TaxID=1674942 RepID=UPI0009889081|nr:hypothetical protein [Caenibacillus caldisaponilyticus]
MGMAKGRKPLSHEGRVGQERLRMNMSRMDCAFNHWPAIAQSSGATTVRFWIGRTAPHLRLRTNAIPACNRSISQASNGRRRSGTAHFFYLPFTAQSAEGRDRHRPPLWLFMRTRAHPPPVGQVRSDT